MSDMLQHPPRPLARTAFELVDTAAGMSGIFLSRRTPLRTAISLTVLLGAGASMLADFDASLRSALIFFGVASLCRHAFLFASFGQHGLAAKLRERLGTGRGFELYEAAAAVLLCAQRLGFLMVLLAPEHARLDALTGLPENALLAAGAVMLALGLTMSVSGTRSVGVDAYYHFDLFRGPRHVGLERESLYRLSENPAYGWAPLGAYGAALLALSPAGMAAAALNQIASYVFNRCVEQAHLRDSARIALEQQLRESLASTSIEAPVRQRRSAPPPPKRSVPHPPGVPMNDVGQRRSTPPPSPRVRQAAEQSWIDVDVAPDSRAA